MVARIHWLGWSGRSGRRESRNAHSSGRASRVLGPVGRLLGGDYVVEVSNVDDDAIWAVGGDDSSGKQVLVAKPGAVGAGYLDEHVEIPSDRCTR